MHLKKSAALSANSLELESVPQQDAKLVVVMTFVEDRFATQINVATVDATVPLLVSIEGTSSDIWPPSGALQEVLEQSNDDGRYLAGVGRAGKSHWSTIVSTPDAEGTVDFDFACRIKTAPDWIGSTYQVLLNNPAMMGESQVQYKLPGQAGSLVCESPYGADIQLTEPQQLTITPSETSKDLPRTERWGYRFRLTPT